MVPFIIHEQKWLTTIPCEPSLVVLVPGRETLSWRQSRVHESNKAIRDGKIPRPPHGSAWQRSPHSNRKKLIFFRDVISLLARVVILLIDTATQEVPMTNI